MKSKEEINQSISIRWKALFGVNLILGIIFWIGLSTNYKLNNLSTDIIFTFAVGIIGLVSWVFVTKSSLSHAWKRLFLFFITPSLIGSIPYIFVNIIWPSGFAFHSPISVDKIEAPDHSKIIEVHYFPDQWNIYCSHSYQVSLHYRFFPILRRDIINLPHVPNDPDPLCKYKNGMNVSIDTKIDWIDNDKIVIHDMYQGKQIIGIGLVTYNLPSTHTKFLLGCFSLLMIVHGIQTLREKNNVFT